MAARPRAPPRRQIRRPRRRGRGVGARGLVWRGPAVDSVLARGALSESRSDAGARGGRKSSPSPASRWDPMSGHFNILDLIAFK